MDTENLLERYVKPTKAVVFLVVSLGRGLVGFLPPWEAQTSLWVFESQCTQVWSCINKFEPRNSFWYWLKLWIRASQDVTCCILLFLVSSLGTQLLSKNHIWRSCLRISKTAVRGKDRPLKQLLLYLDWDFRQPALSHGQPFPVILYLGASLSDRPGWVF